MAAACRFLLELPSEQYRQFLQTGQPPLINIGCGEDVTIRELAEMVQAAVGFKGQLVFDKTKPDGTPRKLLDVSRLRKHGWKPETDLPEGITQAYQDFLEGMRD